MSAIRKSLLIIFLFGVKNAIAAPITFNTALPVGQGAVVLRQQLVNTDSSSGSRFDSERRVTKLISTIAYGITPRLTVFGNVAITDRSLTTSATRRDNSGLADSRLLARYTAYRNDFTGGTFRIAPFAGVKLSTGSNTGSDASGVLLPRSIQTGSGSTDYFGGLVVTYNKVGWGLDAQISHQDNGSNNGFRTGDSTRVDVSYRKLLTTRAGYFLNGLIEFNVIDQDQNSQDNNFNSNTGGTTVLVSPGIQYITQEWIIESALQFPISNDQNDRVLSDDYSVRIGFRHNF